MATSARCDVPGMLKEASLVKATGKTFDRKDDIKRAGAMFMSHAGKFWAWDIDRCEAANDTVNAIPGVGAVACVVAALVTPDEVTRMLDQWHALPLAERGGGSLEGSYHEEKARTRRAIINKDLGITLDEDDLGNNPVKIRRALGNRETLKKVLDKDVYAFSPRMACIEPSKDLARKVTTGKARIVPSKKYGFGYNDKYEKQVKAINPAIVEILE